MQHVKRDKLNFRRFYLYVEESALLEPLRAICREHTVTLNDVYMDATGPTTHAARLECWAYMVLTLGKSATEVGRVFDRDQTSIGYGLRRMREVGAERNVELAPETARVLARAVASKTAANLSKSGRRAASIANTSKKVET